MALLAGAIASGPVAPSPVPPSPKRLGPSPVEELSSPLIDASPVGPPPLKTEFLELPHAPASAATVRASRRTSKNPKRGRRGRMAVNQLTMPEALAQFSSPAARPTWAYLSCGDRLVP